MSKTNDLKEFFQSLLSSYCPSAYFLQCPTGEFPRTEYEFKQLYIDDVTYDKYLLTLNFYDLKMTETIDEIADTLIENIGKAKYYTDKYYFEFYYGKDRQPISESDKSIKRIMMTFEVRVHKRSDD